MMKVVFDENLFMKWTTFILILMNPCPTETATHIQITQFGFERVSVFVHAHVHEMSAGQMKGHSTYV